MCGEGVRINEAVEAEGLVGDITENEWMTSEMECDSCGLEWVSVHPICEWLECKCGKWIQVPATNQSEEL